MQFYIISTIIYRTMNVLLVFNFKYYEVYVEVSTKMSKIWDVIYLFE